MENQYLLDIIQENEAPIESLAILDDLEKPRITVQRILARKDFPMNTELTLNIWDLQRIRIVMHLEKAMFCLGDRSFTGHPDKLDIKDRCCYNLLEIWKKGEENEDFGKSRTQQ